MQSKINSLIETLNNVITELAEIREKIKPIDNEELPSCEEGDPRKCDAFKKHGISACSGCIYSLPF